MAGLYGMDVHEGKRLLVLVHFMAWDLALNDFGKNTILHTYIVAGFKQKCFIVEVMQILRKLYLALAIPAVTLLIVLAIVLLSLSLAFGKPDNLKRWLRQANIYPQVANTIASTASSGADSNALQIQTALKTAISGEFVRKSSESVIDGTYTWLQGKTEKPSYNIDLQPVKDAIVASLTQQATDKLATLPPCSPTNPPNGTDISTLNCRPPDTVSAASIQQAITQATSGEFLSQNLTADTTLPADSKTSEGQPVNSAPAPEQPTTPWYQQAKGLPAAYKWSLLGPWICATLILLLGVGIVFAARNKRSGLRTLAVTTLSAGFLLAVTAGLSIWGIRRIQSALQSKPTEPEAANIQGPLLQVLRDAGSYIGNIQLWWGIGLAIAGVIALVLLYVTRHKTPTTPEESSVDTSKESDQTVARAALPKPSETPSERSS